MHLPRSCSVRLTLYPVQLTAHRRSAYCFAAPHHHTQRICYFFVCTLRLVFILLTTLFYGGNIMQLRFRCYLRSEKDDTFPTDASFTSMLCMPMSGAGFSVTLSISSCWLDLCADDACDAGCINSAQWRCLCWLVYSYPNAIRARLLYKPQHRKTLPKSRSGSFQHHTTTANLVAPSMLEFLSAIQR